MKLEFKHIQKYLIVHEICTTINIRNQRSNGSNYIYGIALQNTYNLNIYIYIHIVVLYIALLVITTIVKTM